MTDLIDTLVAAAVANPIPLALFLLLQVADVATTVKVLSQGGREQNGFIAALMDRLGYGWIVVKLAIACGAAALILTSTAPMALWVLVAVYAWVVWHNWGQIK